MSQPPLIPYPLTTAVARAVVAALVLSPSSVHGAGGLRGGSHLDHNRKEHYPQHDRHQRELASEEGALLNGGMTNWAMTTLESPPSSSLAPTNTSDDDEEVSIDPFTTNLLATNFPYPLKYQTENELSGAVSLHVAAYLRGALDAPLLDLGLHCTKDAAPLGPELRWVLTCAGAAVFDRTSVAGQTRAGSARRPPEVNAAVREAFVGEAQNEFLERLYPRYELRREETGWGAERARRSRKKKGTAKEKKTTQNNMKERSRKKKKKKKRKKKKKKKKSRKNKKQQMKPNSDIGPRPQSDDGGSNNGGLNVMGYVSGSQGEKGASTMASSVQVVTVDDDTRQTCRSQKKENLPMQLAAAGGPRPPSHDGELNGMGYVPGSQREKGAPEMASSYQVVVVDDDAQKRRRNT